ncbi:MurR/RpiR family transcriptional regulator [Roseomonas sp. OT10]|uniref:MurR/RpiR family transcriptional regulator n=1 Tax=Roseomonas cutis TaxID=2897332 RepID=UPI001E3E008C|nr:MurR/RpiR family transcriptional regulator [Roseomonas sp. OT10]UFN48489.1 MurR/RpiR family transcriptional regulator [Roseomonas sp. OT10]
MRQLPPDMERRISLGAEHLGEAGRAVANLIISQPAEAALLTAGRLAEMLGVSESTVVRFAQAIGYAGFPALRRDLQDQVRQYLNQTGRIAAMPSLSRGASAARRSLEMDAENLRDTLERLDPAQMKAAVAMLVEARRVYVIGMRSVFGLADTLVFHLQHILDHPILVDPARGVRLDQMAGIGRSDVLLAMSFPRYSRIVEGALRIARRYEARTIVVTDSGLSPLAALADIYFSTPTRSGFFGNSLTGAMGILNALLSELLVVNRRKVLRSFKARGNFDLRIADIPIDGDEHSFIAPTRSRSPKR